MTSFEPARCWARRLAAGTALAALLLAGAAGAAALPQGLAFLGLVDQRWLPYVVAETGQPPRPVVTASEPRAIAYAPSARRLAYVAADGGVREVELAGGPDAERVLVAPSGRDGYAQPAYDADGEDLFLVVLYEGNSVNTDLALWRRDRNALRVLLEQPSSQFEPFPGQASAGRHLYYSNVHCAGGCGRIVQEIWRLDLLTRRAEQMTLTNAVARQPFLAADEQLYFASNRDGYYHIWVQGRPGAEPQQLKGGVATDSDPVVAADGTLYFVRRTPEGTRLMRRAPAGEPIAVELPPGVSSVRSLQLSR